MIELHTEFQIIINRQEQRIKKLTKDLDNSNHQRKELEAELKLREDACDYKGIILSCERILFVGLTPIS